jgi:hypothetical protein
MANEAMFATQTHTGPSQICKVLFIQDVGDQAGTAPHKVLLTDAVRQLMRKRGHWLEDSSIPFKPESPGN